MAPIRGFRRIVKAILAKPEDTKNLLGSTPPRGTPVLCQPYILTAAVSQIETIIIMLFAGLAAATAHLVERGGRGPEQIQVLTRSWASRINIAQAQEGLLQMAQMGAEDGQLMGLCNPKWADA